MNRYRTLLSNTALISVGVFGSKLLVFFMVRFYTNYLTPSDYGTADLIIQTANLLFPIISLGITEGVFRFAMGMRGRLDEVFTVGAICITAGGALFFVIAPLLASPEFGSAWKYVPLLCLATVFSAFVTFMGSVYMVTKKSVFAFLTAFFGAAVNIALNLLLIPSRLGVYGAAIATFACYFVVFLVRAKNARRLIPFRLYKLRIAVCTLPLALQTAAAAFLPNVWIIQLIAVLLIADINFKPLKTGVTKLVRKEN